MHELVVDLASAPHDRVHLSPAARRGAARLLATYRTDIGLSASALSALTEIAPLVVPPDHLAELAGLAARTDFTMADLLIGTLYYDAIKTVWGCTAFSVNTSAGVLHARNLDWWTNDRLLSSETALTRYVNGPAGPFVTVGWPGFIGAFSGCAEHRFSVTLNSVISADPPAVALPVVCLLRQVLEEEPTFARAVQRLAHTEIASDALLLVTGTAPGEAVVIERTPTRHAVRRADEHGVVVVSNDYRALVGETRAAGELASSSCSRYDRAAACLAAGGVDSVDAAHAVLADPAVRMGITVQHMVLCAHRGVVDVRLP